MRERIKIAGRFLNRITAVLTRPIWENFLFITFMYAIWGITVWREVQYEGDVWAHIFELFVDLYLFCLILHLLPKRIARIVRTVFYVAGYALAFFEAFLSERFLMLYTPTTLRLWTETTGEETKEFFKAYFTGEPLWRTLTLFVPLLLANVVLILITWRKSFWKSRFVKAIGHSKIPLVTRYVVTAFLIYSLFPWVEEKSKMLTFFSQKTSQTAEKVKWQTFYTPFYRLVYSYRMLQLADNALVTLEQNMHSLQVDTCTFRCPQIVLVIGESYNKYHSQLYGYDRATTPWQAAKAEEGSLVAFNDAITVWNLTSNVFKNMFSTHSIEQPGNWCDGILFPALFRKAGYKVAFLTNQYQNVRRQSGVDFNGSFFFNDPGVDSLCFDFRNSMIYRYDKSFIKEYEKYEPAEHNLVIFHLYGQHQKYDFRFTKKDVYFTPDSFKTRKNLAGWMKQMLADYDNATRYNDEVLSRICNYFKEQDAVVVYLSDHGEEIFDHSLMFGRTPADPIIPLSAHYEFEVPMEMWFSPAFMKKHRDVVRAAHRAADKPFMTDDLSHMLMGLAGMKSRYYDSRRDLLNDSFDTTRPRLLKGKYNYDSLMKGTRYEKEKESLKAAKHL